MNNLRPNQLDDLIMNQGYMSQRTKSPRKMSNNINIGANQFYQNQLYPNVNKLNSNRDMSPNKIISKNKPLLMGNNANNRVPLNNFSNNYHSQLPFVESQNRYGYQTKPQNNQVPNGWKNVKSPRSPQFDAHNFVGNQMNGTRACFNHSNKRAEYMAQVDGDVIYYCETCAAKLAAQSFEVIKLPTSGKQGYGNNHFGHNPKGKLMRKRRQIPCIAKYKGNSVYESIIQFLKEIYTVEQYHYENYDQLQILDQHYEHQIQMVDEFYNQLLDILSKMHQDHVSDLQAQQKKHSQMKQIYLNEIYENLSTIQEIVNDLDQNFETVVKQITQEGLQLFNQALTSNRSKVRFFSNQIEQQRDMFAQMTSYKEQRLMEMMGEFQNCLVKLWDQPKPVKPQNFNFNKQNQPPIKPSNVSRQPSNIHFNLPMASNNILQPNNRGNNMKPEPEQKLNILQMHQNNQKSALTRQFQGKGACRQIFQDDEEDQNLAQQVSPKFKNI